MPGIISIPAILQTCSLRTRAVPRFTPALTPSTSTRDESRFSITNLKFSPKNQPSRHFPGNLEEIGSLRGQCPCRAQFASFLEISQGNCGDFRTSMRTIAQRPEMVEEPPYLTTTEKEDFGEA
jgi:hypothetical protein